MIDDLKFVVLNYLTLEEILALLNPLHKFRDRLIKSTEISSIYCEIDTGNFHTVKYLIDEKKTECTTIGADLVCENGYINILEYLIQKGIKPTCIAFDYAYKNKQIDTIKYLLKIKHKPSEDFVDTIMRYKDLDTLKLFVENDILISTGNLWYANQVGDKNILEYLRSKAYNLDI